MALPGKELGKSGIVLPPLVLGGNVFGWTADIVTSLRLLDAAQDGRAECHRHGGYVFALGGGPYGR